MDILVPVESEFLTADELKSLTGKARPRDQIEELARRGWLHEVNAGNEPIVGRFYARLKLAGVDFRDLASHLGPEPDFSKVR